MNDAEQMLIYDPEKSKRKHKQDIIRFGILFCCLGFIFLFIFMTFLLMGVFAYGVWEIKKELDPIFNNKTEIIQLINRTEVIVDYLCTYLGKC